MNHFKTAFFFLRLPVAISLLGHGLVRLPKLAGFSSWMVTTMDKSAIPPALIVPFSYFLPIAEALLGLALLVGFQIRLTLFASIALMSLLILGSCSIENWSAIEAQLLHAFYLMAIYWFWEKNQAKATG